MAASLTPEQALSLAPDSASASAGKALGTARKWQGLGSHGNALWGECQGSGKDPYRTRVDLTEPAFKCSCPSRKFPCKHGIGLLLVYATEPSACPAANPPEWVTEWLASRAERAAKKEERAEARSEREADPEAKARRAEKREARVNSGLAELDLQLRDLVRRGFASLPAEPYSFWDGIARRMVDAQAPGIARTIREIPAIIASGIGWQERLLRHLGRLHLVLRAWESQDRLPEPLREDLRAQVGFTRAQDDVLQGAAVADSWGVWAQCNEELDDGLRVQRSFLLGRATGRLAVLMSFAAANAPMEVQCVPGTTFPAELVFYPSAAPLRALVKARTGEPVPLSPSGAHRDFDAFLAERARVLAANPWIEKWPAALAGVRFAIASGSRVLVDATGHALPARMEGAAWWSGLAHSGGRPALVFAEGTEAGLHVHSMWCAGRFVALGT